MTDYGKLRSEIWNNKDFLALNESEQRMYMLLFSFSTRNLSGIIPLTIRRWAKCSADGTIEKVTASLQILVEKNFIIIDWDTEEVLIRTYIRHDEVWKQPNLMVRCLKFCGEVASPMLKGAIAQELTRIAQEHMPTGTETQRKIRDATLTTAKALEETFNEGFQQPFKEAFDNPSPEPSGEPFPEPFGEPPVVVGYLSSNDATATAPATSNGNGNITETPDGVSKGDAQRRRGTRLPEGWIPPQNVIDEMKVQFPYVDLKHEHAKFCDHWHAKAGRDAVKLDWSKTWRNWIRTAAERTGHVGSKTPTATEKSMSQIDALRDNPRHNSLLGAQRKEITDGS